MLKNSIKYYWEDPERITTVPLSTLDELLKIYPWSNVLRFLYWKRWLIEKNTHGILESDASEISPLFGEFRYMLDHGPIEYDESHFISIYNIESKVEDKNVHQKNKTDEIEEQAVIPEPNQIIEEDSSLLEETHSPEFKDTSFPEELPAESISDEIDQESDAIKSEVNPLEEIPQSIDQEEPEIDDLEDEDGINSEPTIETEHQIDDEDSGEVESNSEQTIEQIPDIPEKSKQEEIFDEKVEVTEVDTPIARSISPDLIEKESVDELTTPTEISFEEELKELENIFLADYESVIQSLDKDIAKLNELHLPESYDEMLLVDEDKTEIDELIEASTIDKKEVEQVNKEETQLPLPRSQPQVKPKIIDKPSTKRNLQFDEELSGFTHWLLKFTKEETEEDIHEQLEPTFDQVESPVTKEVISFPSLHQELGDTEFAKEEEDFIDEEIWTEDDHEKTEEEVKVKKKKGKGKKKGKKKKKKKGKKSKKESRQDIDIGIVSEPLAKLFAAQGAVDEAISMYEKLILYRPEKKSKFAARIKKLKKT